MSVLVAVKRETLSVIFRSAEESVAASCADSAEARLSIQHRSFSTSHTSRVVVESVDLNVKGAPI